MEWESEGGSFGISASLRSIVKFVARQEITFNSTHGESPSRNPKLIYRTHNIVIDRSVHRQQFHSNLKLFSISCLMNISQFGHEFVRAFENSVYRYTHWAILISNAISSRKILTFEVSHIYLLSPAASVPDRRRALLGCVESHGGKSEKHKHNENMRVNIKIQSKRGWLWYHILCPV